MEKNKMKILAIEGPAGSGKTTMINHLEGLSQFTSPEYFAKHERPRYYSGYTGRVLAVDKDITSFNVAILDGIIEARKFPRICLLDRFVVSALVYNSIQDQPDSTLNTSNFQKDFDSYYQSILVSLLGILSKRCLTKNSLDIQILYGFKLPTLSVLNSQRRAGGKTYPYDSISELEGFTKAYESLIPKMYYQDTNIGNITVDKILVGSDYQNVIDYYS